MEIKLLTNDNIEDIKKLYDDIRLNTYTLWDNGYPGEELIKWDIERKGLWGVFDNNTLIAISFVGERCEEGEENFTWKENLKNAELLPELEFLPNIKIKA